MGLYFIWNIKTNERVNCQVASSSQDTLKLIEDNTSIITSLAKTGSIKTYGTLPKEKNTAKGVLHQLSFAIPLGDVIDIEKEKIRILKEIETQESSLSNLDKRLKNKEFLHKAPEDIVQKEKKRLASLKSNIEELKSIISGLN